MKLFEVIGTSRRGSPVTTKFLASTYGEAVQKAAKSHVTPVTVRLVESAAERAAGRAKAIAEPCP